MTPSEQKARDVARKVVDELSIAPLASEIPHIVSAIASVLEAERLEERERCAKIAETAKTLKAWLPTNDDGSGEDEHTTIHGQAIAAAIRSRETDNG